MTYRSAVLADSPLAYWRLGEASGTVMVDESPNGRNGSYSGSPALGAAGLLVSDSDTCVDFDGVNDYGLVAYGSWMNPASLTLEAVIRPDSVTGNRSIIARRDANTLATQSYQFRVSDGKLQLLFLYSGGNVKTASSTGTIAVGTTYRVAATYDGSNIRLYINGALDSTTAHVGGYNAASSPLRIGGIDQAGGAGFEERFDGKIDEPAIFGAALSGSQLGVHASEATSPTTDTAATLSLAGLLPAIQGSLAFQAFTGTATANRANGRVRNGGFVDESEAAVEPLPANLVRAVKVDKAFAYPTPTLVDGRPT